MTNSDALHYIAPADLPEERVDARLVPFAGVAAPAPAPSPLPPAPVLSLDGRNNSPDLSARFPVAFNAFDWRQFSEWQRNNYGPDARSHGSERDAALSGKPKRMISSTGRYGAATSVAAVLAPAGVYIAPLRLTPRNFSIYSKALASPVPADAPVTVTATVPTIGEQS